MNCKVSKTEGGELRFSTGNYFTRILNYTPFELQFTFEETEVLAMSLRYKRLKCVEWPERATPMDPLKRDRVVAAHSRFNL